MQAGDIEFCQCTLNLPTFSVSGFPALRRELSGEEIDNSAWLQDGVQEKASVGSWKPPCHFYFHSKVNNDWGHWRQGNWLPKLGQKIAKSVLLDTFWLQDCTMLSSLTKVYWMKPSMCFVWLFFPCRLVCVLDGGSLWLLMCCSLSGTHFA